MRLVSVAAFLFLMTLSGCMSSRAFREAPCNHETVSHILTAGCFLKQLAVAGNLSGISTNDHLVMGIAYPDPCDKPSNPVALILRATVQDPPLDINWFSVVKVADSMNWTLEKQWTTDLKGNVLNPGVLLPSEKDQILANQKAMDSPALKQAMKVISEHPSGP